MQYPGVTKAYIAHLETICVLLNLIVSEQASILTANIKDCYLSTPLDRKKFIPHDVQQYNIADMVYNDHILILPQTEKLSQDRLISQVATHG